MTEEVLLRIRNALEHCSPTERRQIFDELRKEFPIHALEEKLSTTAEVILEAIDRASDLTLRGIRGIIAEAYFRLNVVTALQASGWQGVTQEGDLSYDFDLLDTVGHVRVQVKNQRLERGQPKLWRRSSQNGVMFVAETQRTRTGKSAKGAATRPYRFSDFDVLAVCLHPSTGSWEDFRYTVTRWLLPRPTDAQLINVYQPVPRTPNADWTDNFETVVNWFRSSVDKTIWSE